MTTSKQKWMLFMTLILAIAAQGCGTSTGNPQVILKTDTYVTASARDSLVDRVFDWLITPALASVSSARVCFKRVRFKMSGETTASNPDNDEDNIDFHIGEVTLSSAGSTLGELSVPTGNYFRIELDFSRESNCSSNESVRITNSNGTFGTQDGMTVKFNGAFAHDGSNTIVLNLQSLMNAWNVVTNDNQIKDQAESVSGSFQED